MNSTVPCAAIADGQRRRHRVVPHGFAHRSIDHRRRRFLNHLLASALRRAVALSQVHRVAVRISKDLDFDMSPVLDQAFEHQGAITKGAQRLAPGTQQCLRKFTG